MVADDAMVSVTQKAPGLQYCELRLLYTTPQVIVGWEGGGQVPNDGGDAHIISTLPEKAATRWQQPHSPTRWTFWKCSCQCFSLSPGWLTVQNRRGSVSPCPFFPPTNLLKGRRWKQEWGKQPLLLPLPEAAL